MAGAMARKHHKPEEIVGDQCKREAGRACQVNSAKSAAPYPARNQATAAAHVASASARKRRRVGLLIRWRWMLNVL